MLILRGGRIIKPILHLVIKVETETEGLIRVVDL